MLENVVFAILNMLGNWFTNCLYYLPIPRSIPIKLRFPRFGAVGTLIPMSGIAAPSPLGKWRTLK